MKMYWLSELCWLGEDVLDYGCTILVKICWLLELVLSDSGILSGIYSGLVKKIIRWLSENILGQ
jgi:uncharacterized protein YuzB (UPF0349 family)